MKDKFNDYSCFEDFENFEFYSSKDYGVQNEPKNDIFSLEEKNNDIRTMFKNIATHFPFSGILHLSIKDKSRLTDAMYSILVEQSSSGSKKDCEKLLARYICSFYCDYKEAEDKILLRTFFKDAITLISPSDDFFNISILNYNTGSIFDDLNGMKTL